MGEMADYALERVMTAEEDRLMWRAGEMSDEEAYDLGIINELGEDSHPPMFAPYTGSGCSHAEKVCKHCGKTGLHWKDTQSGWRLATADGVLHVCDQYVPGGSHG